MNWADLSTLVIILASLVSGTISAHSKGGHWWILILAIPLSFLIGLGMGMLSSKVAYAVLRKELKSSSRIINGFYDFGTLMLYQLLPMVFIGLSVAVSIFSMGWLTSLLMRL